MATAFFGIAIIFFAIGVAVGEQIGINETKKKDNKNGEKHDRSKSS